MKYQVVPAILEDKYIKVIKSLSDYKAISARVQIDICDGVYTKVKSWLPNAYEDIKGFDCDLEFDMMVSDIRAYIPFLIYYDAKRIIVHINNHSDQEYVDIYNSIKRKNRLIMVGAAISNTDSLSRVTDNLPYIDFIQIMTIDKLGKQGEPLSQGQVEKIKLLHNFFLANNMQKEIQVDGGVDEETLLICRDAGASTFITGHYLKESQSKKAAMHKLHELLL
jgi:ribulose-phosphate 3-epimerase